MSKCALDIKRDIIDTVGEKLTEKGASVEGNVGYFPNPQRASAAINSVNKEFGDIVVKQSEQGSFFIDPSEQLVQVYFNEYNKQLPLFQLEEPAAAIVASPETIALVKKAAERMGVDIKGLAEYAKASGMDTTSINGVADLVQKVIAIAEGKEDVALTEEVVHIATAILEQTNPGMVTEMISKIGRFKIYKEVYEKYKDNPYYQVNGKPDIRKIKKEAMDQLIAGLVAGGEDTMEDLMQEENVSLVRRFWNAILDFIKGQYRKADIDIYRTAAKVITQDNIGTVSDIAEANIYLQITDAQKNIQDKIMQTQDAIEKVYETAPADPVLLDSEESNNYYQIKLPNGQFERVLKRVTDRVKGWYKSKFGAKVFTEQEQKFNELKRKYGIKGHADFEEIHARYFNKDGTKKANPSPRPDKINLPSQDMYDKLEKYYVDLVNSFPENTLIFSEVVIFDPKNKEAGTIDLLAVEPDGTGNILDWKFMHITGDDVAWFKQGAFNIQISTYKNILSENYGIKKFNLKRAIPIAMNFAKENPKDPSSELVLNAIAIGSVNKDELEDIRLAPVSEATESTGYKALDKVISQLNGLLEQYSKERVTDENEREFKKERLNTLRRAIRYAQGTNNIAPLIEVIEVMRKDGERILEDWETTYKDRPATSRDSTDADLSDFAQRMNDYIKFSDVFVNISRELGDLVYTDEMARLAKTEEEKEAVEASRSVFIKLQNESNGIYKSREEIKEAAGLFADKHVGQRNLVAGLTKAEAVVKGLGSTFRGVSELPMRALKVLYKLTQAAMGKANQTSLEEVKELMRIREALAKRGEDLRKLVQRLYQKDTQGGLVNKLIHKYDKSFYDKVKELAAAGGNKEWLLANIDVEAYKKEAEKKLKDQIEKISSNRYPGTPEEEEELKEKYIEQAERMWDITRDDFNGFDNPILKRHPLPKWYSSEYKAVMNDPELMALYNFIVKFNKKSSDLGYIQNQVSKTFIPFVRKTMAEELVWDNSLSVMKNFSNSLNIRVDDAGYGKINEVTGELENSIPKYYTYDFTRTEDGVNDYSEVSEDLFKNLILYIQSVNKYQYLTEVEGQIKLVKTIEEFKNHLRTNNISQVVLDANGDPIEEKGNVENTKMFDDFMRVLLYGQKYVLSDTDTPLNIGGAVNFIRRSVNQLAGREVWKEQEGKPTSLIKSMDAANRAFQLKTLGFEILSGAVNAFGGNIQISSKAGNYFKAREFLANEKKLAMLRFESEEEQQMFAQLVEKFVPLKDSPVYEEYKKAGMNRLTRGNLADTLMVFMRKPEELIEKSIFLTLLQNTMMVDGRIVSIPEYVKAKNKDRYASAASYRESKQKIADEIEELKKTKSLFVTKKLVDGKLEIPGLNLNDQVEVQRLTDLTRRISRDVTGGMGDNDINRMSMSIWTRSMMVFKNWIPKLLDTRFGEFRKISDDFSVVIDESGKISGEKYDIGRLRLLGYVLGKGIVAGATNLRNLLVMNEAGIEEMDKMYMEFADKYLKETGEKLTLTREEFIDLIRNNLYNQVKELLILLSLFGAMLALGYIAPDDDDEADRASRNFHRYMQRTVDKFIGELSFFYNPLEFQKMLSGSAFPALGLTTDIIKFTNHSFTEITGMDFKADTDYDKARKEAKPMKYLFKILPGTKAALTYFSIFSNEFAQDFDITIQKESR